MNKQKAFISILLPILFILSACSLPKSMADSSSKQLSGQSAQHSAVNETDNAETVLDAKFYRITRSDSLYYYYIIDENHDVVKKDGPFSKQPEIVMINDHLVRLIISAGPEHSVQYGYYYDIKMDVLSRIFYGIFDQYGRQVAYGIGGKVVVRDIFDKTEFYQEISSFESPLSNSTDPVTDVRFVNDGASVTISYLTGADYKEATETIALDIVKR